LDLRLERSGKVWSWERKCKWYRGWGMEEGRKSRGGWSGVAYLAAALVSADTEFVEVGCCAE